MSAKSKNSSKKAVDRPFSPAVLRRATEVASQYQIILNFEDGEYYGRGLELPGAMDDGKTPDECVRKTRASMIAVVAVMLENSEVPPPPANDAKRTEQINVRVSAEEKLLLEEAARRKGFRGIGDFVRSTSLAGI